MEIGSNRTCGMAVIPMQDGKAQIDLVALGFQTQTAMLGTVAMMAIIVQHPAELQVLQHYVYWTPLFDQVSELIMSVDLATVTDSMVQ